MAEGPEGGYLPEHARQHPEDPYGRGIEAVGRTGIEGAIERDGQFWLARILSRESIERAKGYSLYEGASTEWIIYDRLLAEKVEKGPELPPHIRQRLSNLIGLLRIAMYPNLTPQEQESLQQRAGATSVDMKSLQPEINDEAREDLQWIWATFNLNRPENNPTGLLPGKT